MTITRLTYMSRPTAHDQNEFRSHQVDIVRAARDNNLRDDLTGYLLGNSEWFVQVLEGPTQNVARTLNSILADARHKDVLIFEMAVVKTRMFGDWSMHYSSLDEVEPAMIWDCVDHFRKGSIRGGQSAIHALTRAADRTASQIAQ